MCAEGLLVAVPLATATEACAERDHRLHMAGSPAASGITAQGPLAGLPHA